MLALLKRSEGSAIRDAVRGAEVAAKPGELDGVRVDAGIVLLKDRPFVLSVMTTYLQSDEEGNRAIREVARISYEYFSRLAAGGEYGRQIR